MHHADRVDLKVLSSASDPITLAPADAAARLSVVLYSGAWDAGTAVALQGTVDGVNWDTIRTVVNAQGTTPASDVRGYEKLRASVTANNTSTGEVVVKIGVSPHPNRATPIVEREAQTLDTNTSVSAIFDVRDTSCNSLQFVQISGTWGNTVFTLERSNDGMTFVAFKVAITTTAAGYNDEEGINDPTIGWLRARVSTVAGAASSVGVHFEGRG
tara:strand:+ start:3378 stop:4019 length:642 start_codon:yes stop_codon:yes gene_type:complete